MAWAKTRLEIAPVTESPRAEQHPRGDGVKSVVTKAHGRVQGEARGEGETEAVLGEARGESEEGRVHEAVLGEARGESEAG